MDRKQIAYAIRTRLGYPVTVRPFAVHVGSGWIGMAVMPGKQPRMTPTIPDMRLASWFLVACFLTFGIAYLVWKVACYDRAMVLASEIRDLFRRELGIKI